jgi:alpha-L-arabinofuranosidase
MYKNLRMRYIFLFLSIALLASFNGFSTEYHVAIHGSDDNPGTFESPFRTIFQAGRLARAGDTITVYAGTYRERVDPYYGGTNHMNRILYRAAPGEKVIIKGSEEIKGWEFVENGVWKVRLDNAIFGDYNPYQELVVGDWFDDFGRRHHTGEVYLNDMSFYEVDSLEKVLQPVPLDLTLDPQSSLYQWYCESNSKETTIWANFHGFDPNRELVEINVRPTVFFPSRTGIHYITVNGFIMSQAATNWAPPTAEQTGLIGPNWSKGWIIENNTISHSKCSGISLGKTRSSGHNYPSVYKKKSGHIGQLEGIFSALNEGWSKENVGSHIVRNNTIFSCEQTGICGNLGAIFSRIYGNHIYDIYVKRQWGGHEMAGIKLHAPIDVIIQDNRIHNASKGLWIDWQAQGIRITGNLLYDNSWMDLHLEVSHGPHIIDNNLFLSDLNIWNVATGSAFIHNLFAGQICRGGRSNRFTPYHVPHSTNIAGIMTTMEGDDRYFNNIFIKRPEPDYDIFENAQRRKRWEGAMGFGLGMYKEFPAALTELKSQIWEMSTEKLPIKAKNNLYLQGANPFHDGVGELVNTNADIGFKIIEKEEGVYLTIRASAQFFKTESEVISSTSFGDALIPEAIFVNNYGAPVLFDHDYFNESRGPKRNLAGPFRTLSPVHNSIKLWPKDQ